MKVRVTLVVDAADRYLIATYFRDVQAAEKKRRRASRAQVRLFTHAALALALKDRAEAPTTSKRVRTIARRLRARIGEPDRPILEPPQERNRRLFE